MEEQVHSPVRKKTRRKRSDAWLYVKEGENGMRQCKYCTTAFGTKTVASTIKWHYEEQHKEHRTDTWNQDQSERYLTHCLVVNNISPWFLECPFTLQWLNSLRPGYLPPGWTKFLTMLVPDAYATLKCWMKMILKEIGPKCLCFDGWLSVAIRGYLGIIVHGIDASWQMQSFLLTLCHVSKSETADYVADLVREVSELFIVSIYFFFNRHSVNGTYLL